MKALTQAPKRERKEQKISDAKVTKVESYGIIVELEGGGGGVVPLRELDTPPGSGPPSSLPARQRGPRGWASAPTNQGRPRFSIRRVEEAEARQKLPRIQQGSRRRRKGRRWARKPRRPAQSPSWATSLHRQQDACR